MTQGKVYITGAGPGDGDLITIKAWNLLRSAEVVVYDRLIDDDLLNLVPASAELIYVGKSAKVHAKEQHEINQILVDKAQEGKQVVRLKGGDPFVLGRGGEEAETLFENGIPFEIVPGISSSMAAGAYAGIPVTHRNVASSFAVITGHEDPTKAQTSINWEKLATGVDTLIFLMGMGNLPKIVKKLTENGRDLQTPVALIRQGTTLSQQVLTGKLADIVEKAKAAEFAPPVVIMVGEVVDLRQKLAWFEDKPLFGKRVLVTRSRTQASRLSSLLRERGAQPVELPTIQISEVESPMGLDQAILNLADYDWVVFTSVNGVEAFWKRLGALGLDARQFGRSAIAAIGPATAAVLRDRGIAPDFIPDKFTSEGILDGFKERGVEGCQMLLPRADIAPQILLDGLTLLGARPHRVTAYVTTLPEKSVTAKARKLLRGGKVDIITFASSSTVTNLISILGDEKDLIRNCKTACIGPVTAATLRDAGFDVDIEAAESTIPGLVKAIEESVL